MQQSQRSKPIWEMNHMDRDRGERQGLDDVIEEEKPQRLAQFYEQLTEQAMWRA